MADLNPVLRLRMNGAIPPLSHTFFTARSYFRYRTCRVADTENRSFCQTQLSVCLPTLSPEDRNRPSCPNTVLYFAQQKTDKVEKLSNPAYSVPPTEPTLLYAFLISPVRDTHPFHKFSAVHSYDVSFGQRRKQLTIIAPFIP
jgi:hypothetical protein